MAPLSRRVSRLSSRLLTAGFSGQSLHPTATPERYSRCLSTVDATTVFGVVGFPCTHAAACTKEACLYVSYHGSHIASNPARTRRGCTRRVVRSERRDERRRAQEGRGAGGGLTPFEIQVKAIELSCSWASVSVLGSWLADKLRGDVCGGAVASDEPVPGTH